MMDEYLTAKEIAMLINCSEGTARIKLDRPEFNKYRKVTNWYKPYRYKFTPELEKRLKELIKGRKNNGN